MEFGELKSTFDNLKLIAENQEHRVRYYETRAQNIALACLIWDRFFVLRISQTSSSLSLNCSNWWMVLAFTLSSTSLYFLFFLEAVIMLYRAQNQLDMISKKQIQISQQILNSPTPDDDEAGDSILIDGLELSFQVQLLEYHPFRIVQRKVYIASTLCVLLAVAAFELYASG
ncbi:unnamed protein product [Citrullus colocynthis]|uniref:Uncharacterized protein n=1 Tax=Citrullus colocynthis TaxID=252529 RepID=A0ABP0XTB8_9ROSI